MHIPQSLKNWFVIHFIADMLFAIPLLFFPITFGNIVGLTITEPLGFRLVGAALFGIGLVSLLAKEKSVDSYKSLLLLKILWASAAIVALIISVIEKPIAIIWLTLGIFVVFWCVWVWYYKKIN